MTHKIQLPILVLLTILTTMIASANGGDQRVVEGKYIINLARSPFTPRAGEKVTMLIAIADIKTGLPVTEDLNLKIRIATLGGVGSGKRDLVFEQDNIRVQKGVLEFPYIFKEPGLHEIFFDFAFASNPSKVYEAPDFLLDIQRPEQRKNVLGNWLYALGGAVVGMGIGWLITRKRVAS